MSIEERVDTFPEPWKPEPSDKLVGKVIDLGEFDSGYGSYPTVTILADDGAEIIWHAFHTVAKRELARQRPEIGDRLAVKYFGKKDDGNYERYRVLVEKAVPEAHKGPDWDQVAADAESEFTDADVPPDDWGETG